MKAPVTAECGYCGEPFTRRPSGGDTVRFCSRQHAALYQSRRRHESALANGEKPRGVCSSCGVATGKNGQSTRCAGCRVAQDHEAASAVTLSDLRARYSISQYHAKIRGHARAAYRGEKICLICSYFRHIDVCHLRDVADFPMTATLREVNDATNLVALCKNHHWEFDHGYLTVAGLLKERRRSIRKLGAEWTGGGTSRAS